MSITITSKTTTSSRLATTTSATPQPLPSQATTTKTTTSHSKTKRQRRRKRRHVDEIGKHHLIEPKTMPSHTSTIAPSISLLNSNNFFTIIIKKHQSTSFMAISIVMLLLLQSTATTLAQHKQSTALSSQDSVSNKTTPLAVTTPPSTISSAGSHMTSLVEGSNNNNNNNNQGDIKRHLPAASASELQNNQQPAIEQVAKAEALTAAVVPQSSSSQQQNSAKSFEVCKAQSAINQHLTNLSQIVFQPSDICSSWHKMLRTMTTMTSSDSNQMTTNSDLNPWYHIEQLNLSENNLTVLHDSSGMSRLINLLELKITHNQLSRCEEASLFGLQRLQSLDLSHNKLKGLPAKFFQPVKHTIKKLNLSFNSISVLVPTLFDSLNQLEYLDLSHNDITSHWINGDRLFKNLTQLHYLDLSFNKLDVISSPATFGSLQQLETLSLQHNELRQVPETIQHLRFLSSLDLSQNLIHDITNASYLSNCRLLFNLNLESNLLENITRDAFSDLPALKVLNLANNRIHHLDQQAFDYVPDLHALRLDSNRLVDFGQAFVNLRFLLMLNISSNRISSFDYAQIPLGLQWLDLHSNKIDKLNNYYYSPSAQQQFSASNDILNQQGSIGQQWQSMLRLTTLDASHNLIRELDNTSLPESLETVQLNNNHIKTIASLTFSTKSNLTRINLSHNQLTALPFDALKLNNNRDIMQPQLQQQKFVDVYLANNPFVCNCNMGWFSHLLLASTNPFPGGLVSAAAGSARDQTFVNIHARMASRQLPRVADAAIVNCHLPFGRQTTYTADPNQWSPVMAANQMALQHNHHPHAHDQPLILRQMELLQSVHLCPYKAHCFAACNCCDFDACDCEMSCPENCSCYYNQKWTTNIVDCSANNQIYGNSQMRFTQMMMGASGSNHHYTHHHHHRPSSMGQQGLIGAPQTVKFTNIPEKIPMDVTDLYLDGLELIQLRSNALIGRIKLRTLHLNNSRIHSIENKALATQKTLIVLQLNSNFLTELQGYEFEQQADLRELYLANNRLRFIANNTFTPLKSLQILHLQNNQLYHLNFWSNIPSGHKMISINLGQNPWSCQCGVIEPMLMWLQTNIKYIYDRKSVSCQHERSVSLHLISPLATENSLSPIIYGSNSENYPMFTKDMCLNYTVPIIQPSPMPEQVQPGGDIENLTTPILEDSSQLNGSFNKPPNDEPLPPSDIDYDRGFARSTTPPEFFNPITSPPRNPTGPSVSSLLIGVTSMMIILIVVVLSFVHYRRRMGVWFYSNYGLNMFSGNKPHKHSTNSIGKHQQHHPHLSHQYGVGSSAGSTSSSSAASSNMSHALCQQQSTNGSIGLVTTPLIVTNSNQAIMNSATPYQDDDRLFDAYLTYSKHDEQFINDYIAPELECSPPSYRVALHYRDLPVTTNEFLTDCIIETANASRRVIMVVSEQLLRTEWQQYEFRSAHLEALKNNYRQRLIIIMLGQPSLVAANLDPDMLQWLKSCTCIHWGEKMFWQRLRFAMPELPFSRQQNQHLRYQTLTAHQQQTGRHNNKGSSNQNSHSKNHNLGVNFLKSATGLLSGGNGHTAIPPPMGQQQLVTSSMHQSLGRPLPHPLNGANFNTTKQHQLQLQEEHHYAHLTPTTMIHQQQQHHHQQTLGGVGDISSVSHAYHQPIYGDPAQQQQHRDKNPVHI
uniref:Protein toll n=1 Tax=Aceria tosichella TaxID=561515 RepID=A0A6G1SIB6_9ACAR